MNQTSLAALTLATTWTPEKDGVPLSYALRLTNNGSTPVRGFRLCVSGPARIAPEADIEGGTLDSRISNHSEFAPPTGFVLEPGATCEIGGPPRLLPSCLNAFHSLVGHQHPLRRPPDGAPSTMVRPGLTY